MTPYAARIILAGVRLLLPDGWEVDDTAAPFVRVYDDGKRGRLAIGFELRRRVAPPVINREHLRRK